MPPFVPTSDHDLPDALREAVAAIRQEPLPMEALRRSVERAKQLSPPQPPLRSGWTARWALLWAAVAASLLLGVLWRHGQPVSAPPANDLTPREGGQLMVSQLPVVPTRPISMREIGTQWADWERIRLPCDPKPASQPLWLTVRVQLEQQQATTSVELRFAPAAEVREFEYGLPPDAIVQGVESAPGGNLLRGTLPPGVDRVQFRYQQQLAIHDKRYHYSFPLPEQRLEGFYFLLEVPASQDRGAIFLPENAACRQVGNRVRYELRFGPVRPSGAISYLPLIHPLE
jgi:hypothetical protein